MFQARRATVGSGTVEIQRNVIARRALVLVGRDEVAALGCTRIGGGRRGRGPSTAARLELKLGRPVANRARQPVLAMGAVLAPRVRPPEGSRVAAGAELLSGGAVI